MQQASNKYPVALTTTIQQPRRDGAGLRRKNGRIFVALFQDFKRRMMNLSVQSRQARLFLKTTDIGKTEDEEEVMQKIKIQDALTVDV